MKPGIPLATVALLSILAILPAHEIRAQVLPLNFTDGNGNTSVDQFTGVSGSGWNTAWSSGYGSDTIGGTATVESTSPITTGGGNYLHVTYGTGSGSNRSVRASRQWNTSGVSLTSPITMSFDFRADTAISGAAQSILIFGSSVAASTTGPSDSWKITIDGGGPSVYNGTTLVSLATSAQVGTNVANTPLRFTLNFDPVADTYTVAMTRLDTNVTFTSGTLALRNGADASLSFINFVSNGGASVSNLGYSIDNISIVAVPEPHVAALALGGLGFVMLLRRRRA